MAGSSKDDERESEGRQKERTIASGGEGWRAEKGGQCRGYAPRAAPNVVACKGLPLSPFSFS